MAEQAELEDRIARLDAAISATADALARVLADRDAAGASGTGAAEELATARERIGTLESAVRDSEAATEVAVARAEAAEAKLTSRPQASAGGDDTEALHARIADLEAARAQDLAEMKSLLADLEPLLETADA